MTSWSEIVTLVLKMLVAYYQTHGFCCFWNHFQEPQLDHMRHMRLVHQAWCKPKVLRNGKSSETISIQLSST